MTEVKNRISWLEDQISQTQSAIDEDSRVDDDRLLFSNRIVKKSREALLNNFKAELRQERETGQFSL